MLRVGLAKPTRAPKPTNVELTVMSLRQQMTPVLARHKLSGPGTPVIATSPSAESELKMIFFCMSCLSGHVCSDRCLWLRDGIIR